METGIAILIFLFGTAVGSFLNVVALRIGVAPVTGRSHCPHCDKTLEWFELIPILSFFLQGARCRGCRNRISWQYPLVEFLTGAVFLLVFWRLIWASPAGIAPEVFLTGAALWVWPLVLLWWYYASVLIAISIYDIRHYLIPSVLIKPAIFVAAGGVLYLQVLEFFKLQELGQRLGLALFPAEGIIFSGVPALLLGEAPFGAIGSALIGVLVAAGLLGALYWFSAGKAMGFGDVKIGILMGLALGWPDALVALFLAFTSGMIWGVAAMISGKKVMKSYLPFGPFLAFGMITAMLAGDIVMNFYFRVLPQIFLPVY